MSVDRREYRILMVDDDLIYRDSACMRLARENYHIVPASNTGDAQTLLKKEIPFHLCIIDNEMPDVDGEKREDAGIELAIWIKREYPYTSRLIITASHDIELVKKAVLKEGLTAGYYVKDNIATGYVESLPALVSEVLSERLVPVMDRNDFPTKCDPLDFWNAEGTVERDIYTSGSGVVQFGAGSFKAHLHRATSTERIRLGAKVLGRTISAGEVQVVPVAEIY